MANNVYCANVGTGGSSGALDAVDGAGLADGDVGLLVDAAGNVSQFYTLNATLGGVAAPPVTISPVANAGNKRWELVAGYVKGSLTINDGTNIGLMQFTSDILELYQQKHGGVVRVSVEDGAGNKETALTATGGGSVAAYYDNSKKVETTATGITVTGSILETVPTSGRENISITASVGAKALTVALKGEDGNDPSATNQVNIKFRSATLTDSRPTTIAITAAAAVVLPSGGTLGFTAAEAGRLYVWAINNAGAVELALSRTADLFPESNLVTTVAIGAGSDLATAMYSTTQRTGVACHCIGYVEITTGGVAGEWDNSPTKVQVMYEGIKRTGDVVQTQYFQTGGHVSGSDAVVPYDDTIPAITEGYELMTLAITPTSLMNKLYIDVKGAFSEATNTGEYIAICLHQDAISPALAVGAASVAGVTYLQTVAFTHVMTTGTVSSTTFRVRGGLNAGPVSMNGESGRVYGGVLASSIKITEIFA